MLFAFIWANHRKEMNENHILFKCFYNVLVDVVHNCSDIPLRVRASEA